MPTLLLFPQAAKGKEALKKDGGGRRKRRGGVAGFEEEAKGEKTEREVSLGAWETKKKTQED